MLLLNLHDNSIKGYYYEPPQVKYRNMNTPSHYVHASLSVYISGCLFCPFPAYFHLSGVRRDPHEEGQESAKSQDLPLTSGAEKGLT